MRCIVERQIYIVAMKEECYRLSRYISAALTVRRGILCDCSVVSWFLGTTAITCSAAGTVWTPLFKPGHTATCVQLDRAAIVKHFSKLLTSPLHARFHRG